MNVLNPFKCCEHALKRAVFIIQWNLLHLSNSRAAELTSKVNYEPSVCASLSIHRCVASKSVSIWHCGRTDGFVNIRTNTSAHTHTHAHNFSLSLSSSPEPVSRWLWGHKASSDSISTKVIPRRISRPFSAFLLKHNSPNLAFWHHL